MRKIGMIIMTERNDLRCFLVHHQLEISKITLFCGCPSILPGHFWNLLLRSWKSLYHHPIRVDQGHGFRWLYPYRKIILERNICLPDGVKSAQNLGINCCGGDDL